MLALIAQQSLAKRFREASGHLNFQTLKCWF